MIMSPKTRVANAAGGALIASANNILYFVGGLKEIVCGIIPFNFFGASEFLCPNGHTIRNSAAGGAGKKQAKP